LREGNCDIEELQQQSQEKRSKTGKNKKKFGFMLMGKGERESKDLDLRTKFLPYVGNRSRHREKVGKGVGGMTQVSSSSSKPWKKEKNGNHINFPGKKRGRRIERRATEARFTVGKKEQTPNVTEIQVAGLKGGVYQGKNKRRAGSTLRPSGP